MGKSKGSHLRIGNVWVLDGREVLKFNIRVWS